MTKPSTNLAHASIINYNYIIYANIAHIPMISIINKPFN
jgi:hypothetical protein